MKTVLPLIMILFSVFNLKAQTSEKNQFPVGEKCKSVLNKLSDLHKQTLNYLNEKNYDKAYPIAKEMLEIAETNCVNEKNILLSLAINLAKTQENRGKFKDAREIFGKNILLASEVFGETSLEYDDYLNSLIKLSANEVSDEQFEKLILKSVAIKKTIYGDLSLETVRELLKIANFYRKSEQFEKAESNFQEAISISDEMPSNETLQKLPIIYQYRAYLIDRYGDKAGRKKDQEFMKDRPQPIKVGNKKEIINGMAIKLVKPAQTLVASEINAFGDVLIEIVVGEDGKVIKAKAISGHRLLQPSAEQAAKASVFLPTYADGKPISVTGLIIYRFNP